MRNRAGISADFAGNGAGVCRKVMSRAGEHLTANGLRRGVFPALAVGGSLLSELGLSLSMR